MPSFEDMFRESKEPFIIYNGIKLVLYDLWDVEDQDEFCLTFESVGSDWRQGVSIGLEKPQSRRKRGEIMIAGETFTKPVFVWEDSAPTSFNFTVLKPITPLEIYNAWQWDNGMIHYLFHDTAMRVEQIENGRRYFCSDGHIGLDNLDDLIFKIERVKQT